MLEHKGVASPMGPRVCGLAHYEVSGTQGPLSQEGGRSQGLVQEMHLVTPPENPYFKPLALQALRNLSHPYWQDSLFLLPYMQPANSAASPGLLSSTRGQVLRPGSVAPCAQIHALP